jgi:Zn-dependent protease
MMGGQIELFRIGGIPVRMDFTFLLLAFLWTQHYWSSGNTQLMSAGFIIAVGLFVSILLHELGHAWTGKWFGVGTRVIELNGMGGLCHFDKSIPGSLLAPTVVYLAGPFANLLLWQGCKALALSEALAGKQLPIIVLATLASANFMLLVFKLLPAFPLDGGRVLETWLARLLGRKWGPVWSVRIVAGLGLLVVAFLVYLALPRNFWMLLMAFSLFLINYQAWQSVSGRR